MRHARRYWDNFNASDPVTQGIAVVALILLAIFTLPYFSFPWQTTGGSCLDLTNPYLTGSNQSLLSGTYDQTYLHLELVPTAPSIIPGAELDLSVRFINYSMAPMTLYLTPDQGIFRYNPQESGLLFSVVTMDGRPLGEPVNVRAPNIGPQIYAPSQLHVLGPRSRCSFDVTISASRLASAGVTVGQYRINAVYRNQNKGVVPTPGPLSPTPEFPNLGVWTGQVQSNEVILTIGAQPAPTAKPAS